MSAAEQFKAAVTSEAVPTRDGAAVLSEATQGGVWQGSFPATDNRDVRGFGGLDAVLDEIILC